MSTSHRIPMQGIEHDMLTGWRHVLSKRMNRKYGKSAKRTYNRRQRRALRHDDE